MHSFTSVILLALVSLVASHGSGESVRERHARRAPDIQLEARSRIFNLVDRYSGEDFLNEG